MKGKGRQERFVPRIEQRSTGNCEGEKGQEQIEARQRDSGG